MAEPLNVAKLAAELGETYDRLPARPSFPLADAYELLDRDQARRDRDQNVPTVPPIGARCCADGEPMRRPADPAAAAGPSCKAGPGSGLDSADERSRTSTGFYPH